MASELGSESVLTNERPPWLQIWPIRGQTQLRGELVLDSLPRALFSARRPNFQTKGDPSVSDLASIWIQNNMEWDLFPYFMIMKLNLFMACNEWSVKIIKSN